MPCARLMPMILLSFVYTSVSKCRYLKSARFGFLLSMTISTRFLFLVVRIVLCSSLHGSMLMVLKVISSIGFSSFPNAVVFSDRPRGRVLETVILSFIFALPNVSKSPSMSTGMVSLYARWSFSKLSGTTALYFALRLMVCESLTFVLFDASRIGCTE